MAEALVAGAFLSSILNVLFDRLASRPVLDLIRGRKFSESPFNKLKIKLLAVNALLNDAEQKQFTDQTVKAWLDELKHVVYIAQDLLDEIATDSLRLELERESHAPTDQVQNMSSTCLSLDEGMASKIDDILDRLEYIAHQKDLFGLKHVVGRNPSQRLPSTSLVEETGVYGKDEDKKKIIEFLLSEDDLSGTDIGVITIVGMGGVGKTTLAQLVYNKENDKLKNHFNLKAWVCVSEEFDVVRVTKTILEAVTSSSCDIRNLNSLQLKLKESLTGKKFLLILDDVWNENYNLWHNLQKPFSSAAKGSKIIVTTRNEYVAKNMRSVQTHHLNQLLYEDCWLLFAKHAFDNNNSDKRPELEVIGRKIVEKCKGLPLAAITLGCVMRSKADAVDWYKILESELWELPTDKNDILPALLLCYHYLPSHLKCCFAYCSIFPKDYEFKKKQVVVLWMAEEFLQDPATTSKQMEDVGHEYFDELISMSFFQQSSWNESCFVMHDLVNDLANFVSGEFCFRLEGEKLCRIPEKTRHLSIGNDGFERSEAINGTKFLRSFLSLSFYSSTHEVPEHLLSPPSCLRTLSLSRFSNIKEVLESISDLKHLRYLNLSGTSIQKLPNFTSAALCNLQTLILACCVSLTELPANTGKLINLRHLDVSDTKLKEMPMHMSRLINLQTLSTFIVGKTSGSTITELRELNHHHGGLDILNLQNVVDARDAQEANLKDKTHLEKLLLEWNGDVQDSQRERDVLNKLRPLKKLKALTISYYGGTKFPNWLGDHSFSNMEYLCLSNCKYCFSLPPLGMLPSLQELSIKGFQIVQSVGPEFYGSGPSSVKPFSSLEILRFEDMPEWEEWFCCAEFTHLKRLYIKNCPKLKGGLPDPLPWQLEITNCKHLVVSFPSLVNCGKMVLFNGNGNEQPSSYLRPSLDCLQWEVSGIPNLKEFPSLLMQRLSITKLVISNCPSLEYFPLSGLPTTLKEVYISECGKLELHLPQPYSEIKMTHYYSSAASASLELLHITNGCDSLKSFPLGLFPKLHNLKFENCPSLEFLWIPEGVHVDHLASLHYLDIYDCPKFESFPNPNKGGLPIPNLRELKVVLCRSLKSLPEQMYNLLPSLEHLSISLCPEQLQSFPEGGLPSSLRSLHIEFCYKLVAARRREWGLQRLPNLKDFRITSVSGGVEESFPEEWLLPPSLTSLLIWSVPNLKYLNKSGFQHLTSLEKLSIWDCPNLQSLPEDALPNSLSELTIWDCPLLKQWCQRENGEGWPKIAHIPKIKIDNKVIS